MSQLNLKRGELLYKRLMYLLIFSLKQVPVVGGVVEFAAGWQGLANKLRQEQERLSLSERIAQLEEAAAMSPAQAREIAKTVIEEERRNGQTISSDQEEAVLDLASSTPATVRERTQATLRQARRHGTAMQTVLPLGEGFTEMEQNEFYRSLLPARRPRFREGEPVPNANPRWRLTQLIGAGGFGEVWEVQHQPLKDRHAVKFCQDSLSAKVLKQEAKALFKLHEDLPKHPHIVSLEDLSLDEEPYWLAFEYVNGGTLEALMRAKRFSWEEALELFMPIVQGMSAVHQVGIVHRDLKPANILLTDEGQAKITDFGIGKVMVEQEIRQTQTRFTILGAGHFGYASPEQMDGQPAHPADDVYSLAVILWQMLNYTLKPPPIYVQDSLEDLNLPKEVRQFILNCFRPRQKRFQHATELWQQLQSLRHLPKSAGGWWQRWRLPSLRPTAGMTDSSVLQREAEERRRREVEAERQRREAEVAEQKRREAEERKHLEAEEERRRREAEVAEQERREAKERKRRVAEEERQRWEVEERKRREAEEECQRREAEENRKGQLFTFETVLVDRRGQIIKRESRQARQVAIDLGKGVKLEMVHISAGTFLMGAALNEAEAQPREYPQHQVTLKSFYMGKYPVTQAQWQVVMGNNPSSFKGENRPVETVSWQDAKAFCDRLSQRTGQTFRLPSEAEWEYACRAGTMTPFYFGETITSDLVNYNGNYPYGDAPKGKYREETTPVGSFPPNAFGLYDMHGNVWEWCEDVWHENYEGAPRDGSVWETGGDYSYRLLRGGSWSTLAVWCRAAPRNGNSPDYRPFYVGWRVVLCAVWTL